MNDDRVAAASAAEDVTERFVSYRRSRDRRLRNELVEEHRGLALHLARRFADRGEPLDDLVQVAMLGLLKSVERFDPDRGLAFSSFATPTISGELKRHFRDRTWSVRVPRRTQELRLEVRSTGDRLSQRLGRPPTVDELATEIGVSADEVLQAFEAAAAYRSASLSSPGFDDDSSTALEARIGDDPTPTMDRDVLIGQLLDELPERERRIVELRFFEDLTQSEIAARVGISQMHVSRLLRRTLLELRDRLGSEPGTR